MDIRLLGNVEIHGDADVVRPRRSGERCVLAVLALHARTPITATALADRLWPAGGRPDWLRYDRAAHTAVLDIDPDWVDYHQAHALAGLGLCLLPTTDSTQAIALLQQAHSLYRALGAPEATEIQTILSTLDN